MRKELALLAHPHSRSSRTVVNDCVEVTDLVAAVGFPEALWMVLVLLICVTREC